MLHRYSHKLNSVIRVSVLAALLPGCGMLFAQTTQPGITASAVNAELIEKTPARKPVPAMAPKIDEAALTFSRRCTGCHTIGHGQLVGPDLQVVQPWDDETIAANIRRMQGRAGPLTDHEVSILTDLLQDPSAGKRVDAARQQTMQQQTVLLRAPSAVNGQRLFQGQRSFQHGGPACDSCHTFHAEGGSIAIDLSDAATRLGKSGLISTIEQPGNPMMIAAFRHHLIAPQDAADLAEFLSTEQQLLGSPWTARIPLLGLLGAVVLFVGTTFFYRQRRTGARARLRRR